MIRNCEHEPKVSVGGFVLSVCRECRAKNIVLFHQEDLPFTWLHQKERRVKAYRYQDLRVPTMEDLT